MLDSTRYPFRFEPYKHQAREFELYRDDPARMLLWQMRTGKTKATIDLACYRYRDAQDIDGLLVLAPNGVHSNWVRKELPAHMWLDVPWKAHTWRSSNPSKRKKAQHLESLTDTVSFREGLAILAVNSECLIHKAPQEAIKAFMKGRRIMIVFDESHNYAVPDAKRTKLARGLAKKAVVTRTLTGTAVDNTPLAAYSQYQLLEEGALGFDTYKDFKEAFAVYETETTFGGRTYPTLKEYKDLHVLQDRMAKWSSVVLREDVDDMPALVNVQRDVELPDSVQQMYEDLRGDFVLELENGQVLTAEEGGKRILRLQQLLGGFMVTDDLETHDLTGQGFHRLDVLEEEIWLARRGKAIVWCRFRFELELVMKRLEKSKTKFVLYRGGMPQSKRDAAIDAFSSDDSVTVFLGQPAAGGAGLNLSAQGKASTVLWYSHTYDLIHRQQANERATYVGGDSVDLVDLVVPSSVDVTILQAQAEKRNIKEELAGVGMRDKLLALIR